MHTRTCNVPGATHAPPTLPPPTAPHQPRPRVPATLSQHLAQHSRAAILRNLPLNGGRSHRCRRRAAALEARAAAPSNPDTQQAETTNGASSAEGAFPEPFGGEPEAPKPPPVTPSAAAASPAASDPPAEQPPSDDAGAETAAAAALGGDDAGSYMGLGELADVEELRGVRVKVDDNGKAVIEYLVHWKVSPKPSSAC